MIVISDTIKNDCKSNKLVYREYISIDGAEVDIKGKMSNTAYKNTTFFGTFNLKMLTFTTENDIDYKKKIFDYYKEVNGNAFKIGSYIVTDVKDSDSNEEVTITAYDYGLKFAIPYITELNYEGGTITLFDVLQECCTKCGVTLNNTTIENGTFIVDSNQFIETQTYGDVVAQIAGISGNFATINENNQLQLLLSTATDEVIDEYVELIDKRDTQPITSVCIGKKDIIGENVVLQDEELVALYGENWLVIQDNPFAYTQAKRTELITALFNKVKGFTYSSFESEYSFKPYMQLGDLVQFKNKDNELINSIVLKIDTDYDDIKLSAPSITKATVEYQQPLNAIDLAKRTEIIVDKQEQTITSLVSSVDENTTKISTIEQDVDGITISVSSLSGEVDTLDGSVNSLSNQTAQLTIDVNELRSEIGDVTDITTQEEGAGSLTFTDINQSEPINITIRPTAHKDISYIYPHSGLFPSSSLFPQNRILRFYNSTTDETFDYTLPGNLRYYDATTYDELYLDYAGQTCKITRKVDISSAGVKSAKVTPVEENYDYPIIPLTSGNYTVTMLGYPNAYLKIRLMSQNMYTSQFATRVEVSSAVTQSATAINLEVAKKVGKTEIISSINQTAESIKIQAGKVDIVGVITAMNNDTTTTINGNKITTGSITANQIAAGTITASKVASDIITTSNFSAQNINADKITTGTLSTDRLSANVITTSNFSAQNINADKITAGTINGTNVNITNLNASNITTGTINGRAVNNGSLSGNTISGNTITGGSINIASGSGFFNMSTSTAHPNASGMNIGSYGAVITDGGLTFKGNAKIEFRNASNQYLAAGRTSTISFTYLTSLTNVKQTTTLYFRNGVLIDYGQA